VECLSSTPPLPVAVLSVEDRVGVVVVVAGRDVDLVHSRDGHDGECVRAEPVRQAGAYIRPLFSSTFALFVGYTHQLFG